MAGRFELSEDFCEVSNQKNKHSIGSDWTFFHLVLSAPYRRTKKVEIISTLYYLGWRITGSNWNRKLAPKAHARVRFCSDPVRCLWFSTSRFFSHEQAKSECDWLVMSSVFVASQSSHFFLCSRKQIDIMENRLNPQKYQQTNRRMDVITDCLTDLQTG